MAFDAGSLQYTVEVVIKQAQQNLATFDKSVESAEKNLKSLDSQAKKSSKTIGTDFSKAAVQGSKAVLGLVAAVTALGGVVAKNAIEASSNLNESINAVNVTFGEASESVLAFGQVAAQQAGLSARAFNEAAVPIGALLQNVGIESEAAAASTVELTQRAADLASVFNVDVEQALGAITSGLRGQTEPLLAFGANLSAAQVEAFAFANGIAETGTELTEQQKVLARTGLLLEQTNQVQGDFVNTSGGLANQLRVIQAQFENVQATIGDALVPVLEQLIADLLPKLQEFWAANGEQIIAFGEAAAQVAATGITFLVEKLIEFTDFLINNKDAMQIAAGVLIAALIPAVIALVSAFGPAIAAVTAFAALGGLLVFFVQQVSKGFQELGPIIKTFVTDKFEEAKKRIEDFKNNVIKFVEEVKKFIEKNFAKIAAAFFIISPPIAAAILAFKLLRDNWDTIMETLKKLVDDGLNAIVRFFTITIPRIFSKAVELAGKLLEPFIELPARFLQFGIDTIEGFIQGMTQKFTDAVAKVTEFGNKIINGVKSVLGIASPSKVFREFGINTTEGFAEGIEDGTADVLDAIASFADAVVGEGERAAEEAFTGITDVLAQTDRPLEDLVDLYAAATRDITEQLEDLEATHKDKLSSIKDELRDVTEEINDLRSTFETDTKDAQTEFIENAAELVIEASDKRAELLKELEALQAEGPAVDTTLGVSTTETKAEFDAAEKALKDQIAEQNALLESSAALQLNLDDEIAKQREFNNLNELEQLNFRFEQEQTARETAFQTELLQLEERRLAVTQQLEEEQLAYEEQRDALVSIEETFTETFIENLQSREDATKSTIDRLIAEYARLESAARSAQSAGANIGAVGAAAGFAEGGFTGNGSDRDVAGLVHANEYVVPANMLRALPGLGPALEAIRTGVSGVTTNKNITVNVENHGSEPADFYGQMDRIAWMTRYAF